MPSPSPSERRGRHNLKILLASAAALALCAIATACGTARTHAVTGVSSGWSFGPAMPQRRSYTASAEISGRIYVAAGMVGESGRPLNVLERFDPRREEWSTLTPLPEAFSAGAGARLGERMYVVGGDSPRANGRQVFAFDPARQRWTGEPPLPARRTNLAAVGLDGKLYAIGGLDPIQPVRTVFVFDPSMRRWSRVAPLPKALHAIAAVDFHGEIWVLGGRLKSEAVQRSVWIYNPQRNRWRAGPTMPSGESARTAAKITDGGLGQVCASTATRGCSIQRSEEAAC